jgi:long-chain fatty acid transport protein
MRKGRCRLLSSLVGAALSLAPATMWAQNSNDLNSFDFSLPGARSRAMGGAFVAVADDATAVYSNPAGLTQLFLPEVSGEGRVWRHRSRLADHGHAFGPARGVGADTIDGLQYRTWEETSAGLSFLSFVYPGSRWAVGAFRHQLAKYRMERQTQGPFFDCVAPPGLLAIHAGIRGLPNRSEPFCEPHTLVRNPDGSFPRDANNGLIPGDGVDREAPKDQQFALNIHSYGGAGAYDVTDRLSIGAAVQYFHFEISARNLVYGARNERKYLPADLSDSNLELEGTQHGTDSTFAFNLGALWRASEQWTVGGSFRQGPKFSFTAQTARRVGLVPLFRGIDVLPSTGTCPVTTPPTCDRIVDVADNPFHVPDTFALGAVFRPSLFWRIGFEYDRVNFSQLVDEFRQVSSGPDALGLDPEGAFAAARTHVDDAHQLRAGAERTWVRSNFSFAARGGVWYDPQHQPYFRVNDAATGMPAPRWALLFPKQDNEVHWTAGVGLVFGQRLQLDAAADFSEPADTYAVSMVVRLPELTRKPK